MLRMVAVFLKLGINLFWKPSLDLNFLAKLCMKFIRGSLSVTISYPSDKYRPRFL